MCLHPGGFPGSAGARSNRRAFFLHFRDTACKSPSPPVLRHCSGTQWCLCTVLSSTKRRARLAVRLGRAQCNWCAFCRLPQHAVLDPVQRLPLSCLGPNFERPRCRTRGEIPHFTFTPTKPSDTTYGFSGQKMTDGSSRRSHWDTWRLCALYRQCILSSQNVWE